MNDSPKRPRIVRNDYRALHPPTSSDWRPSLAVSVVIPAFGGQEKLDLTLAALAAQTYPAELMEVVVVDDNSTPALRLPQLRPEHTRLVVPTGESWGSAHAVNTGVSHADGQVILRLDSDMVAYRDHVEAHLRWHHSADYLAVLGHKRFVDYKAGTYTPEQVHEKVLCGEAEALFEIESSRPQWIEKVIADTDGLTVHHPMNYRVFIGASGSLHRDFFKTVGGLDAELRLGSDTEFAYRLAQAGAVFVPETESSAWHLGIPQMLEKEAEGRLQRLPYIVQRVPLHGLRHTAPPRAWRVPLVDMVIDVGRANVADVDAAVAPVLAGPDGDVRITLVTGQSPAAHDRAAILSGDGTQLRLIEEMYAGEARVRLSAEAPEADPAVPYRLHLPRPVPLRPNSVGKLLGSMERADAGLVLAELPGSGPARLERTAAFCRARHITGGGDLDHVVAGVWGVATHAGLAAPEADTAFNPPPVDLARRFARRFLDARARARLRSIFKK
ncbi:glycosyltransferase family 2 protein [Glycomyces buryatensis]|uniref:Glycosyltransferase family 2 protein n=1 Tax=Glycomyces buryatensis TaxID=2570927 RepID=A0A4S8QJB2_9ACTN|nr:glycosyltransferase family 2 protein [Glycomyces buryatensis]THV43352.1 glycosyltransferase family 2 protein [Glycomyces buryatensis]